jgi:hypothetical protein
MATPLLTLHQEAIAGGSKLLTTNSSYKYVKMVVMHMVTKIEDNRKREANLGGELWLSDVRRRLSRNYIFRFC